MMGNQTTPDTKKALRRSLCALRNSLSSERRLKASSSLLSFITNLGSGASILSFAAYSHEIDTSLANLFLAKQDRLFLPKVEGQNLGIYRISNPQEDLHLGFKGILEPNPHTCRKVDLSEIDFILVPGLGFDNHNHRLGYGGGFYDRLLKNTRTTTLGIGFHEQHIPLLPATEEDVPLSKIIFF